jgi:RNA polymerase-binding protein DksA
MEAEKIRVFRERLDKLRGRVAGEFNQMVDADRTVGTGDQSSAPTHLGDVDSEGLEAEIELMHNEGDIISSIDAAMQRIDNGTFGICENCDKEIAEARLEAIPYIPLCIDCARLEEAQAS